MIRNSLKKLRAVLMAVMLAGGVIAAGQGAAHADEGDLVFFPLSNPFLYLDVYGGSMEDGAPVIQWPRSGMNQVWYTQYVRDFNGNLYEMIINRRSGKCLTTDGTAGHQLYQWSCQGTPNQLWDIGFNHGWTGPSLAGGPIRNPESGLLVDVNGGSITQGAAVILWHDNGSRNQRWNVYGA